MTSTAQTKRCTKCGEVKALDAFSLERRVSSGKRSCCKACAVATSRKWCKANPEKREKSQHKYRVDNRKKIKKVSHEWYVANLERGRETKRKWNAEHPRRAAERHTERCKRDPQYRLECRLRNRLYMAIKHDYKAGSAVSDLGCSIPELQAYLEARFRPGMTWDNHSRYGWHIDHIVPLSSFDLTDRKQLLKAVHFSNLQPLWAEENMHKGAAVA